MSKRFQNVFRAFVRKELTETLHSMFWILLFSVIVSNVLQYVTMQAVSDLNLPPQETALQFGSIMMYMSVIIIMFVGHTLINRYIYEERTTKTIHVMLSGGMSKTAIWCAKLAVAFLLCMILLLLSVALRKSQKLEYFVNFWLNLQKNNVSALRFYQFQECCERTDAR